MFFFLEKKFFIIFDLKLLIVGEDKVWKYYILYLSHYLFLFFKFLVLKSYTWRVKLFIIFYISKHKIFKMFLIYKKNEKNSFESIFSLLLMIYFIILTLLSFLLFDKFFNFLIWDETGEFEFKYILLF